MTLRERLNNYQNEILQGDLPPQRAAEILTYLSSLYGNILDEVQRRQMKYNKRIMEIYDQEQKANRAKIKAETTKEYKKLLEARNADKLCQELIRSLKYYLKSKSSEWNEFSTNG